MVQILKVVEIVEVLFFLVRGRKAEAVGLTADEYKARDAAANQALSDALRKALGDDLYETLREGPEGVDRLYGKMTKGE